MRTQRRLKYRPFFLPSFISSSPLGRFRGYRVLSAHCGGCHTMVVASPIPGFMDPAAGVGADDSDNAVETDLAADRGRVAEDQQVRRGRERESVIIICVSEQGLGSPIPHSYTGESGIHRTVRVFLDTISEDKAYYSCIFNTRILLTLSAIFIKGTICVLKDTEDTALSCICILS